MRLLNRQCHDEIVKQAVPCSARQANDETDLHCFLMNLNPPDPDIQVHIYFSSVDSPVSNCTLNCTTNT